MTRSRAVLFDVGGTLVEEPEVDFAHRLVTALGIDAARVADVSDLVLRTPFTSAHVLAERLQAELGTVGDVGLAVRELWDAERDDLIELSDAVTCVAAVSTGGAKVGIVANLASPAAEGFRITCPAIVPWIDAWTLSCEQGSAKPSATIFQAALDALGVKPADALMVGDSLEHDAGPALALGMSAIWLRRGQAGAGHVVAVDPHAAPVPVPAEVVPKGAIVARTLLEVRRMVLTWLWSDRTRHDLTAPLKL